MVLITTTTDTRLVQTAQTGVDYFPVRIQATIRETNPALTRVGATLDWNDGSRPVIFTPGNPITVDKTRNLTVGSYYITLTGFNYLQPSPQRTAAYFSVEIKPQQILAVPQSFLFGPILPLDDSFPNSRQWNFNTSTDLNVLKSSVKMLLITTKGERIMQPQYGTLLRRVVFEPSTDSIQGVIKQEIDDALAQFEPRVSLDTFSIQKADPGGRSIIVNASFLSKVGQSTFDLSVPFSQ